MNLSLFLDTSIAGVGMAIADLDSPTAAPLWMEISPEKRGSASLMSEVLERGMRQLNLRPLDMDLIAVSRGPGSFTGIKTGLAWAYGLAAPAEARIKWMSLSATEATASYLAHQNNRNPEKPLVVLLPSTRTHGYASHWDGKSTHSALISTTGTEEEWHTFKKKIAGADIVWAGNWPTMEEALGSPDCYRRLSEGKNLLETGLLGMIREAYLNGVSGYSPDAPVPNYLRKSTAEERLETLKGTV